MLLMMMMIMITSNELDLIYLYKNNELFLVTIQLKFMVDIELGQDIYPTNNDEDEDYTGSVEPRS